MTAPLTETEAQRRERLDHINKLQRIRRANATGDAPAPAEKPKRTRAQMRMMQDRAAKARAAKASYRSADNPLGRKPDHKPKPKHKATRYALVRAGTTALPAPFERTPRVRGEIRDDGTRTLIEHIPAHAGVDMGIVADLVLAIAAKLSKR